MLRELPGWAVWPLAFGISGHALRGLVRFLRRMDRRQSTPPTYVVPAGRPVRGPVIDVEVRS